MGRLTNLALAFGLWGGLEAAALAEVGPARRAEAPADPRPQVTALRLSEAAVLSRFTAQVRQSPELRQRAIALWRTHFAAQAAALEERFRSEVDWRPVLADASALVDEFLEESLLPREGVWRARPGEAQGGAQDGASDGSEAGSEDRVWIETLDPRTGQRVRHLRRAPRSRPVFAPGSPGGSADPASSGSDRLKKLVPSRAAPAPLPGPGHSRPPIRALDGRQR